MEIIRDISTLKSAKNCAVTVGTFDGLHLGHFKILDKLFEVAKHNGYCSTLVTLYPHPKLVLGNAHAAKVKIITTIGERIEILKETQLDQFVIIPFDKKFAGISYENFVKDILIGKIGARAVIVGYDHAFGKNREGNFSRLQDLSGKYGFSAYQVEPFQMSDTPVSSTLLRTMILDGEIEKANRVLRTKFQINGRVVPGDGRGKELHFPTANVELMNTHKLLPRNGVYAVDVRIDENLFKGMMNIGVRPTFLKNDERHIEVHVHEFSRDIYGEEITIYLKKRLRDEMKFSSRQELIKQLQKDKQKSLNV